MLHVPSTVRNRTFIPLRQATLCLCQQETLPSRSLLSSYIVGPLDPAHVLTIPFRLASGRRYSLLMPVSLPLSIMRDSAFRDGHQWNAESEEECDEEEEEEQAWTSSVPCLLNHLYHSLTNARLYRNLETGEEFSDWRAWEAGWLLGDLPRLAERDRTLALVGLAHLRFLLRVLTRESSQNTLSPGPSQVHVLHGQVIQAYRTRVQEYRAQGCSYDEAQRLALKGDRQASGKGARHHGRAATY